ncbi:MAG: Gfo/Idh/MocA family oxidoreductase [Clostridiales bacterium]|nr:Gfo/Idh/MocA family oxidoreductase [Clostridiales bacterium]
MVRTEKKYGFGIIGCGAVSKFHLDAVQNIKNAELIAVCDISEEMSKRTAENYNCINWYTDYKQLLGRDDIDIVSICTPSGLRRDIAILAAQMGKHIIVEKPIEVTLERIDEILSECEKNEVVISGIFNLRYNKHYSLVKEAISSGRLGKLILGDAYIKWYRSQEYYDSGKWRGTKTLDGGGALMNQSIHFIDLLQWMMGPVKHVFGEIATLGHHDIEVEDTAVATVKYENGAIGVIEGTTAAYPGIGSRLDIHGENGTIVIEDNAIKCWEFRDHHPLDLKVQELNMSKHAGGMADPLSIDGSLHQKQIEEILDCISKGKKPMVNGYEARKSVEIIHAIYKSAHSKQLVNLPMDRN